MAELKEFVMTFEHFSNVNENQLDERFAKKVQKEEVKDEDEDTEDEESDEDSEESTDESYELDLELKEIDEKYEALLSEMESDFVSECTIELEHVGDTLSESVEVMTINSIINRALNSENEDVLESLLAQLDELENINEKSTNKAWNKTREIAGKTKSFIGNKLKAIAKWFVEKKNAIMKAFGKKKAEAKTPDAKKKVEDDKNAKLKQIADEKKKREEASKQAQSDLKKRSQDPEAKAKVAAMKAKQAAKNQ